MLQYVIKVDIKKTFYELNVILCESLRELSLTPLQMSVGTSLLAILVMETMFIFDFLKLTRYLTKNKQNDN